MRTNKGTIASLEAETKVLSNLKTPEQFRSFLSTLSPTAIFFTNDCFKCPLAMFFQTGLGVLCGFDPDGKIGTAPKWALAFGQAVDREPGPTITAQRALEILDTLPKEPS